MLSPRPLRPNNSRRIGIFWDVSQRLAVYSESLAGGLVGLGAGDESLVIEHGNLGVSFLQELCATPSHCFHESCAIGLEHEQAVANDWHQALAETFCNRRAIYDFQVLEAWHIFGSDTENVAAVAVVSAHFRVTFLCSKRGLARDERGLAG